MVNEDLRSIIDKDVVNTIDEVLLGHVKNDVRNSPYDYVDDVVFEHVNDFIAIEVHWRLVNNIEEGDWDD